MIPTLYEKTERTFETFGFGFLPSWIDLEVIEERNGEFYLQGELPVGSLNTENLAIDRIIFCASAPGKPAQPFRIQELSKPSDNETIKVYAPHITYQLTQTAVRPLEDDDPHLYSNAQDAMDVLWTNCKPTMNGVFAAYSDIVLSSPKPFLIGEPTSVRSALGGIDGSMIDVFGGELEWDNRTVSLLKSRGKETDIVIRYGDNLETLAFDTDATPLVTAFVGYAKYEGGVTIMGDIVYLPGYEAFAYPRMQMLDFTETFKNQSTIATSAQVTQATQAAVSGLSISLKTSINVTVVPDSLQNAYLCDTLKVVHPGYEFMQSAKIVRVVFDPILERYKQVTIGEMWKTVTGTIAKIYGATMKKHSLSNINALKRT